jgi:hypothetical protein
MIQLKFLKPLLEATLFHSDTCSTRGSEEQDPPSRDVPLPNA